MEDDLKEEVKDELDKDPEVPEETVDDRDLDALPVDPLELFGKLPKTNRDGDPIEEGSIKEVDQYLPSLYEFGGEWFVDWYDATGDAILSFYGETPKQAIIRAYEHFFGKLEPDYPYEQPPILEVAVRQFAMLPTMSRERGIVQDSGEEDEDPVYPGNLYKPALVYYSPENWGVEWVSPERGVLGLSFKGETPEEAIQKAWDNFFDDDTAVEELPKRDRTMGIIDGFNCCLGDITKEVKVESHGIIIILERNIHLNREILNNILSIIPEDNEFMYDPQRRLILIKRAKKCHCPAGDCCCNKPKPKPEEPNDDTGVEYPELDVENPEVITPEPDPDLEDGNMSPWDDFK